jgi:hypothetical protein
MDIAVIVESIVSQGTSIKATRNPARHRSGTPDSACSIMREALASLGTHLGEDAVETIWRNNKLAARKFAQHRRKNNIEWRGVR